MQGATDKDTFDHELKSWISAQALNQAPSLQADYKSVIAAYPGNPYNDEKIRRFVADLRLYWTNYITEMISTKRVPDGKPWGVIPELKGDLLNSDASQCFNVMVCSFTPASLKGILFISCRKMFEADQGANFAAEMSVLANDWKTRFGSQETPFFYTIPGKELAPKVTRPEAISGKNAGYEMTQWWGVRRGDKDGEAEAIQQCREVVDFVVREAYK
jgi:hypothetical protein